MSLSRQLEFCVFLEQVQHKWPGAVLRGKSSEFLRKESKIHCPPGVNERQDFVYELKVIMDKRKGKK